MNSLCACIFHVASQSLPSDGVWGRLKRGLSVWREKISIRNATIFNLSPSWTSRIVCFDAFWCESSYFPRKWHFKADGSSCPFFFPSLTHAQQMVQRAWHRFPGSVLGRKSCQKADGFFEVVHSGNNSIALADQNDTKLTYKRDFGIWGFLSFLVPAIIFH